MKAKQMKDMRTYNLLRGQLDEFLKPQCDNVRLVSCYGTNVELMKGFHANNLVFTLPGSGNNQGKKLSCPGDLPFTLKVPQKMTQLL